MPKESFDYIVVGSGAAGAIVAARLSEDSSATVLLLEVGPDDKSIYIQTVGGYFKVLGTERTFLFETEDEPQLNGRRLTLVQGRTLGGGTSVNAMCYLRGQHSDYEDWKSLGCTNWGWDDVLPYFQRSESNIRLTSPYHGTSGPMPVSDGSYRQELCDAFVRAAQEVTLPDGRPIRYNHDFNGEQQEGVGYYQVMSRKGERASTSRTFLEQARSRRNLVVRLNTMVCRLTIEAGRATGVTVRGPDGRETVIEAKREVVLSAGTFGSPKLLMLSGIGPAAHLSDLGIPVVADVQAVGEGYQDHVQLPYDASLKAPIGLFGQDKGLNKLRNGAQWTFFRTGVLSSNVVEAGGFIDFDGDGRPEVQFNAYGASSTGWGDPIVMDHRVSFAPFLLTCHSRGRVRLKTKDPADNPSVSTNLLSDKRDVAALVRGIRLARNIFQAPSMAKYVQEETLPGNRVGNDDQSIETYIREKAKTGLHPVGTCKMSPAEDGVVDETLKLKAIDGVRIVDASIMPTVIRGNTTAPTMMIGERGADFIKAAYR